MSILYADGSAIYNIVTKIVTFEDWDNTTLKSQTVEVGGDGIPPSNPTRNNYIFTGWSPDYTNVQSDLTVTAQYVFDPTLYTFTTHSFTSCGKTGREGPTLGEMQAAYAGEVWLSSYFELGAFQGYQVWTVPGDGSYEIQAAGAAVGSGLGEEIGRAHV